MPKWMPRAMEERTSRRKNRKGLPQLNTLLTIDLQIEDYRGGWAYEISEGTY